MPIRDIYQKYENFIFRKTPLYRWAILPISIGFILLIIGGLIYYIFGDNLIVAIFSIIGASLIGSLSGDIRRPWDRHSKGENKNRD